MARFRGWADTAPTGARRALLARCQALLGERPPDQAFAEAIERGDATEAKDRRHRHGRLKDLAAATPLRLRRQGSGGLLADIANRHLLSAGLPGSGQM